MKSFIRMLADDFTVHYRSLDEQTRTLYQQDSEHVAIVDKKEHNTSLSKSASQLLRLDEVFPDTATDAHIYERLAPVFSGLLDGVDQTIVLFQTYTSVMSQVRRRVPDASPNERVPYAVEFAYCSHHDSLLNRLLEYISQEQHKIVQLNVEFGIFEVSKAKDHEIYLKNLIFNQPVHPEVLRERIMPEIVKNSVSSPSLLKLRITSTDTWEVRSRQATLQIAILPKICSDHSVRSIPPFDQLASETALFMGPDIGPGHLAGSEKPLAQSGTTERLADRMKAQRCQCMERRGTQRLLIENAGLGMEGTSTRKYGYQLYTEAIQFANTSCFRAFRASLDYACNRGVEFAPPKHAFMDPLKPCLHQSEPTLLIEFAGVSDCCADTISIARALARARTIKSVRLDRQETVEVDREEYEFMKQASIRAGILAHDYADLRAEYNGYMDMSRSEINILRERGNCLTERASVLREQLSASKRRYQNEQELTWELEKELAAVDKFMELRTRGKPTEAQTDCQQEVHEDDEVIQ